MQPGMRHWHTATRGHLSIKSPATRGVTTRIILYQYVSYVPVYLVTIDIPPALPALLPWPHPEGDTTAVAVRAQKRLCLSGDLGSHGQ